MSNTELFRQKFDPKTFAKYCRENLTENFVTDFEDLQITDHKLFQKVELIGSDTGINDLKILIVELKNPNDPRITLTKKIFELMKVRGYEKTLVAFWHPESNIWRLSLVSLNYGIDEKGKVTKLYSNPKRYSYTLGEGVQTLKTADKYLSAKFNSWEELLAGFSITALNKEFYDEIELLYVGMHDKILSHNPGLFSIDQSKDFALKLLGRLIFCWFLRAKGWVSDDVLSSRIIASFGDSDNYYDRVLEALFFETLNKPAGERKYDFVLESGYPAIVESLTKVPYLNGGLFDPKLEDHKGRVNKVENKILYDLIYLFEQYHFTVDESTSSDVELGIDPEMMGRVFENFILDRSTKGAFYTPREIVDYMVESSILESVRGFTKFENLNIDSLKKTINLDDYDYTNTLIQYPRRTLITTLDILQDVEISLYTIAKIRGWKLVEEDKFGKFPHRHKEITERVWSRLLDTEFEIKNVFWAKSKEVKLHRDRQELTKLPKLGAIIKIEELEYVVIFSVYFDPAASRSRLIIDTIYGAHGTKTDKLLRQSTANHTELVEFLDKKNIPTEGIKSIVDGLPVLDGYYQRILAERQLSEIFTVLQATYSSIIPKPKNSVNTYSGSKIQLHVTNVLDNTPKLKHQKKTQSIIDNLHNLQILDPACGSGAFPMGVLQKLVDITHELAPSQSIYDIKLKILKSCIYGVDIMPIAVEISRLRCWLSLVVDQDNDATKAQLLPNLEFNFVCANSLVGIQKGSVEYLYDPLVESTKLELDKIRQLTFEPGHNKTELEQKWKTASYALSLAMASGYRDQSYELINSWNPFQNHSSAFFDPMWMFGIEAFDLVIGNPPYIQLQADGGALGKLYEKSGYESFAKTGDIYALFYEKSANLLNQKGLSCFITSNKWLRAGYGESLRKFFLTQTRPIALFDLGSGVFESATVDSNILLFGKK
jgi:Eco57I restriction-modification methylase